MKLKFFFFLCLSLLIMNCKSSQNADQEPKEGEKNPAVEILNQPEELVGQTYQLTMLQVQDARYAFNDQQPTLTFDEENSMSIKLSVNSCGGSYEVSLKDISFSGVFCTEACCDTKEEMRMINLLGEKTYSYQMDGKKLKIFNEEVVLKFLVKE